MFGSALNSTAAFRLWAFWALGLLGSCAARPPRETGQFRPSELVELTRLDPSIRLDIRYATPRNFRTDSLCY